MHVYTAATVACSHPAPHTYIHVYITNKQKYVQPPLPPPPYSASCGAHYKFVHVHIGEYASVMRNSAVAAGGGHLGQSYGGTMK